MAARSKKNNLMAFSLAALGVVYGDIGTSPLYTINQIFFGHGHVSLTKLDILGAISLVFWALTLLISIKYVAFVLRADDESKGGVFALYNLLQKLYFRSKKFVIPLLIFAAGLLLGDGVITPAMSVISSTEGLANVHAGLTPLVVPVALLLLTGLFVMQKIGTAKIGSFFGPAISVWFVSIAALGYLQISRAPSIFLSVNPYYALHFLLNHSLLSILFTIGAVMLAITGGEAMYADLGHFGAPSIRFSWFFVVYPALILNYLGQGAYLLSNQVVKNNNVFYSMVPHFFLFPMIIIATIATIIASQALISGAFSLVSQAVSLKLMPYLKILHTYKEQEGQIYVPFINWALYIACILLVVIFKSSNNLASAYGVAVSGVMLVTSLSMMQIARLRWKWHPIFAYGIFGIFSIIDICFFAANSIKIIEGGYIPLGIGLFLFFVMTTWQWGKKQKSTALARQQHMTVSELINKQTRSKNHIPNTSIILSPVAITKETDFIPMLGTIMLKRYKLLPQHIIFLTVKQLSIPYSNKKRHVIIPLHTGKKTNIYSVILNYGFRESPNAKLVLHQLAKNNLLPLSIHPKDWFVHIIRMRTSSEKITTLWEKIRYELFKFLYRNSNSAEMYFGFSALDNISSEIFHVSLQ
jgi:KUP system potassium uptake protein